MMHQRCRPVWRVFQDRCWDADETIARPPRHPPGAVVADGILRGLEPGLIDIAGKPLAAVLAPAYPVITAATRRSVPGDESVS